MDARKLTLLGFLAIALSLGTPVMGVTHRWLLPVGDWSPLTQIELDQFVGGLNEDEMTTASTTTGGQRRRRRRRRYYYDDDDETTTLRRHP